MQPLSPGQRNYWGQAEPDASEDSATPSVTDREGDQEPPRMYCRFIPNSRCDLLERSASKAAKQHKIWDSCVWQLYSFSFLMQHHSGFMMLLETPSYQLLPKPCLLCKLFLFFLFFFALLFEKTPFWKHDKRSHPTQCHNISIHQRGDVTVLKSALRDARLSLLFKRDQRLAPLAY